MSAITIFSWSTSGFSRCTNLKASIKDTSDINSTIFSDFGAWFGYALPKNIDGFAGFAGPLIMDMDGRWLSTNFNQLQISIDGKNVAFDDSNVTSTYYPGTLTQVISLPQVTITLQIIFVSNRQAILQTHVINTSKKRINISLIYKGNLLLKEAFISKNNQEIVVDLHSNNQFYIRYSDKSKYHIRLTANGYTANHEPFNLTPGEERNLIQEYGYYTKSEEKPKYITTSFHQALLANEQRWNTWLSDYFTHTNIKDHKFKKLAVKSIITLITNWRSPFKDLYHDGLFPSVSYQGFYGVWSWDSWKQAVGLSLFNPWLAQENIRCMFDYQDRYGMIADCINPKTTGETLNHPWLHGQYGKPTDDPGIQDFLKNYIQN